MPFFRTSVKDTKREDADLSYTAYYIKDNTNYGLRTALVTNINHKNFVSGELIMGDGVVDAGAICKESRVGVPIRFSSSLKNADLMFERAKFNNYKYNINLPSGLQSAYAMFHYSNFNSHVELPNSLINCGSIFLADYSFNMPINIPLNAVDCSSMFALCYQFNQPIVIRNNVQNCDGMFSACYNFNQPVTIPNSVKTCASMFSSASNLNSPIIINNGVEDCGYMFASTPNFNQSVVIPRSVKNIDNMFYQTSMDKNVYILGNPSIKNAFYYKSRTKRINVFVTNVFNQSYDRYDSWIWNTIFYPMSDGNGYYNDYQNLYIYNNYVG